MFANVLPLDVIWQILPIMIVFLAGLSYAAAMGYSNYLAREANQHAQKANLALERLKVLSPDAMLLHQVIDQGNERMLSQMAMLRAELSSDPTPPAPGSPPLTAQRLAQHTAASGNLALDGVPMQGQRLKATLQRFQQFINSAVHTQDQVNQWILDNAPGDLTSPESNSVIHPFMTTADHVRFMSILRTHYREAPQDSDRRETIQSYAHRLADLQLLGSS